MGHPQLSPALQIARVSVERVLTRAGYSSLILLSVLRIGVFLAFLLYWFSGSQWWFDPWRVAIGGLCIIAFLGAQMRWSSLFFMARPLPCTETPRFRVAVVTTCVPSLEPLPMIERTLIELVKLDYPHDTWLLDEGDEAELRNLCRRVGVRHFSRKNEPWYRQESGKYAAYTKHGNYNAWLQEKGYANYDILIAFDPDHVPVPEFTSAVLGYFADPSVAYVQAPQAYYNQSSSLIARGAAEETYGYYSAGQMASFGLGRTVVTGCHCAHRLSALREVGGFPDHLAEDLVLTARYGAADWKGIYVPQVLATGCAPVTWSGYIHQQLRWTQSLLDIKLRRLPRLAELSSGKALLDYLQGFGYLYDAILAGGALLVIGAALLTGKGQAAVQRFDTPIVAITFALLAASEAFRWRFYLKPAQVRGPHWRAAILRLAKWPYTLWSLWVVIKEAPTRYVVTPKTAMPSTERLLWPPHFGIVLFLTLCLVAGFAVHGPLIWDTYVWAAVFGLFSVSMMTADFWPTRLRGV